MSDPTAPSPPPTPMPAERVIGDYELKGEVGRGGMGVVYRARQSTPHRIVALKMLTGHYGAEELTRFLAEAETAAGLHHTNIIQIYEVGETEGAPFYSMEYLESGSLADRLRNGPMEGREAAQLLMSVARALHFAHRNGVIHRDMKPANILLDPDGVPKVTDFGIAKRLTANSALTVSGAIIGTPTYMAPEQAKGTSREVGAAADIYSLGAILYEMLAGRPPFLPDDSETALTVRVITEEPVSPAFYRPGISRDLETICLKCLEKNPRDRYQSAAAFAEDLRRFLDDESILAKPRTTLVRTVKWIRRHPWRFVSRTALVTACIAGAIWFYDWEFYKRPHTEYAAAVQVVNGGLEPAVGLQKEEIARRRVSLRLTRRGRSGAISLVEVLNPRGHPALIEGLELGEAIPVYIEGLAGQHTNFEKTPECASIEFEHDGRMARTATARDRNGRMIWRFIYDRTSEAEAGRRLARAHLVNLRRFDTPHTTRGTHFEIERDSAGHDVKVIFFNSAVWPTRNGENVFGYKMERNKSGWLTQLTNLDALGKPMKNSAGVTTYVAAWDSKARLVRFESRDGDGKAMAVAGISAMEFEYDNAGNQSRVRRLGLDGKLARFSKSEPVPDDWVLEEISSNEAGEVTARKFFKLEEGDKLTLLREWRATYDQFGYPREITREISAEARAPRFQNSRLALQHDERGNLLEEKTLDSAGQPVLGENGYAIKKLSYKFGQEGMFVEERYFDATGAKTFCSDGYHRLTKQFDSSGILRRQTMEELDRSRFPHYRDVIEPEWDSLGVVRRRVLRYENEQGDLAQDVGLPYAQAEENYDDLGRAVLIWNLGCPATAGAPVFRVDLEYSGSILKRRIRQACDPNRKPLAVSSTGMAMRTEEEFDQSGAVERKLESGFDENICGFSTRETNFSGGVFRSVTRKRSDGSLVEEVRVFILDLAPKQAKTRELKVGDQLLEANGTPVRSAAEWNAVSFPGGWLEVLRDGKRVRIEGFQPGALGITVEERANP